MSSACERTRRIVIYGSLLTSRFYRNARNVEVVVVKGYRRIYIRGLVFIVMSRRSAFHALVFEADDDKEMQILDKIEGHPETYERTCIEVEKLNGEAIPAWIYMPTAKTLYQFRVNEKKDDLEDSFVENIILSGASDDFPMLAKKLNGFTARNRQA